MEQIGGIGTLEPLSILFLIIVQLGGRYLKIDLTNAQQKLINKLKNFRNYVFLFRNLILLVFGKSSLTSKSIQYLKLFHSKSRFIYFIRRKQLQRFI